VGKEKSGKAEEEITVGREESDIAGEGKEKADGDPKRVAVSMCAPVGKGDAHDQDGCEQGRDIEESGDRYKVNENGNEAGDDSKEFQGCERTCPHM